MERPPNLINKSSCKMFFSQIQLQFQPVRSTSRSISTYPVELSCYFGNLYRWKDQENCIHLPFLFNIHVETLFFSDAVDLIDNNMLTEH